MAHGGSRGPKMGKQWVSIPGAVIPHTADGTLGGGLLDSTTAQTVLRMLGSYIVWPTTAPTAGDQAVISLGIGIVSSDAAALGATAMPDPSGEPEFPWLFWEEHDFRWGTTSLDPNGLGFVRRHFDIRSMRRMKPREALVAVTQYTDLSGTPAVTISMAQTRVLIGLH